MEDNLLNFETAMRDFRVMFPSVKQSEIEEVLRRNDGDVAKTIDDLLAAPRESPRIPPRPITSPPTEPPPPLIRSPLPPAASPAVRDFISPPPSYEETVQTPRPAPVARNRSLDSGTTVAPQRVQSTRRSRLSVDELGREKQRLERLKRENERKLDKVSNEQQARLLEDEQLALLIQRRELVRCMQTDGGARRSMSQLPAPVSRRRSSTSNQERENVSRVPEGPVLDDLIINNSSSERDIRQRLKNLSKVPKARITQLASMIRKEISS